MNCSIQLEHAGFFHLSQWDNLEAEFCFGLGCIHGRRRNMSLAYLTMTRQASRDQWKSLEYMALKKYFIYFQMNCSIQLEHAGFFSFVVGFRLISL